MSAPLPAGQSGEPDWSSLLALMMAPLRVHTPSSAIASAVLPTAIGVGGGVGVGPGLGIGGVGVGGIGVGEGFGAVTEYV